VVDHDFFLIGIKLPNLPNIIVINGESMKQYMISFLAHYGKRFRTMITKNSKSVHLSRFVETARYMSLEVLGIYQGSDKAWSPLWEFICGEHDDTEAAINYLMAAARQCST